MEKKVVAINASPRKGWNTDKLVTEAARGAIEAGAEVVKFDLYALERFTGCISCFGCKRDKHKGECIYKDGLAPVLQAIRQVNAVIIGSPNYLGDVSAAFRALYERLMFQNLTYRTDKWNYNEPHTPVLFIMTSNSPADYYPMNGYDSIVKKYQQGLSGAVGNTQVFVTGNTVQVPDYSRYDWTIFDPEERKARHEELFPQDMAKVFELGKQLVL